MSADNASAEVIRTGPETIRRRYAATLITQFFQLIASVVTVGIVPGVLGPVVYGNYSFLLTTAMTLRGFLEPSTQQAFFTFSSQDKRSGALTKLYGLSLLLQIILIFGIIGIAAVSGVIGWLWAGQQLDQIILVTLLDWALFLAISLRQLGDSKGLTVRPQIITTVMSMFSLITLLAMLALRWLNLYTFVGLNLFFGVITSIALGYFLLVQQNALCWAGSLRDKARDYLQRWWHYAAPLIALEYYTPIVAYLSTYLVQVWYGSAEQGYLALATRWSALVLVFGNAALMIYWREIAYLTAQGYRARAIQVYLRFNRLLFFVALTLAFWLALSSSTLVKVLAGDAFQSAVPVLMLMAFYPVQQTFGQLAAAAFKATERTQLYRNLTIWISIPDLALTYFLLAPSTAIVPGLGLGALGVAMRLVLYGLVSVQSYEWLNFRFFGLSYKRSVLEKLVAALAVGACALVMLVGSQRLLETAKLHTLVSLSLSSASYFAALGGIVMFQPRLIGMSRGEIAILINQIRGQVSLSLQTVDKFRGR